MRDLYAVHGPEILQLYGLEIDGKKVLAFFDDPTKANFWRLHVFPEDETYVGPRMPAQGVLRLLEDAKGKWPHVTINPSVTGSVNYTTAEQMIRQAKQFLKERTRNEGFRRAPSLRR